MEQKIIILELEIEKIKIEIKLLKEKGKLLKEKGKVSSQYIPYTPVDTRSTRDRAITNVYYG